MHVYETKTACKVVCVCVLVIEDVLLFVSLRPLLFLLNSDVFRKHPRRCLTKLWLGLLPTVQYCPAQLDLARMAVLLFADGRVVARFGLLDTRGHSCTPLPEYACKSFSGVVQGPDLPGHMACQFSVDLGSFLLKYNIQTENAQIKMQSSVKLLRAPLQPAASGEIKLLPAAQEPPCTPFHAHPLPLAPLLTVATC